MKLCVIVVVRVSGLYTVAGFVLCVLTLWHGYNRSDLIWWITNIACQSQVDLAPGLTVYGPVFWHCDAVCQKFMYLVCLTWVNDFASQGFCLCSVGG